MKDELGKYYYPFPQNKKIRTYVQEDGDDVFFRLWNADAPELWDEHGWIPYKAIKQAEVMYDREKDFKPNEAYDLEIARAILKEDS